MKLTPNFFFEYILVYTKQGFTLLTTIKKRREWTNPHQISDVDNTVHGVLTAFTNAGYLDCLGKTCFLAALSFDVIRVYSGKNIRLIA